jgi:ribosomal protein L7/L12
VAIMPPPPEPESLLEPTPADVRRLNVVYEVITTLFKSMRMLRDEVDQTLNRHDITIEQLCVHLYLHENKVKAIKTWKDYCGVGLKEAKDSVEALVAAATAKVQEE